MDGVRLVDSLDDSSYIERAEKEAHKNIDKLKKLVMKKVQKVNHQDYKRADTFINDMMDDLHHIWYYTGMSDQAAVKKARASVNAAAKDGSKNGEWNLLLRHDGRQVKITIVNPQGGSNSGYTSRNYKSALTWMAYKIAQGHGMAKADKVWVVESKWNASKGDWDVKKSYWHKF